MLKEESLTELKAIAEHETLHLLTNRLGCAALLREQFAISRAMTPSQGTFLLLTRDIVPRTAGKIPAKPQLLRLHQRAPPPNRMKKAAASSRTPMS